MRYQFATPSEIYPIYRLFESSGLGEGLAEISRRVTIPLYLRQLITFYEGEELCGFVTFAWLNKEAESHMPTVGILPNDWQSGDAFWVVDFAATKGTSGYQMLREVTKWLGVKKARYFRHKHREIREVRRSACQVAA